MESTSQAAELPFAQTMADLNQHLASGNYERALALADFLSIQHPGAVRVLRARAGVLERIGDMRRALEDYRRVLEIVPTDHHAMTGAARCHAVLGEDEDARTLAFQALDYDAGYGPARGLLRDVNDLPALAERDDIETARQYFSSGLTAKAMKLVRKQLQRTPDRSDLQLVLAEMLWRSGQRVAAAEQCQTVLFDKPDCLPAHVMLAGLWRMAGAMPMVDHHRRAALELDPDGAESRDWSAPQVIVQLPPPMQWDAVSATPAAPDVVSVGHTAIETDACEADPFAETDDEVLEDAPIVVEREYADRAWALPVSPVDALPDAVAVVGAPPETAPVIAPDPAESDVDLIDEALPSADALEAAAHVMASDLPVAPSSPPHAEGGRPIIIGDDETDRAAWLDTLIGAPQRLDLDDASEDISGVLPVQKLQWQAKGKRPAKLVADAAAAPAPGAADEAAWLRALRNSPLNRRERDGAPSLLPEPVPAEATPNEMQADAVTELVDAVVPTETDTTEQTSAALPDDVLAAASGVRDHTITQAEAPAWLGRPAQMNAGQLTDFRSARWPQGKPGPTFAPAPEPEPAPTPKVKRPPRRSPQDVLADARACTAARDLPGAAKAYRKLLNRGLLYADIVQDLQPLEVPDNHLPAFNMLLGDAHMRLGDTTQAMAAYTRVGKLPAEVVAGRRRGKRVG